MISRFLDPRYGTLGRLDYFLVKYVYLTIAMLLLILPTIFLGFDYFPPFYLFFPAALFMSYLSFLFDIRRLRDMNWSLWLLLIPLSPLVIMLPAMASSGLFPAAEVSFFDIMERYPFIMTTIVLVFNLVILVYQALLLFVRGKAIKSLEELQDEYEKDIELAEERFKSGGRNL